MLPNKICHDPVTFIPEDLGLERWLSDKKHWLRI